MFLEIIIEVDGFVKTGPGGLGRFEGMSPDADPPGVAPGGRGIGFRGRGGGADRIPPSGTPPAASCRSVLNLEIAVFRDKIRFFCLPDFKNGDLKG